MSGARKARWIICWTRRFEVPASAAISSKLRPSWMAAIHVVRPGDIADQRMIKLARRLAEHQPGLDAAPTQPDGIGQMKLLGLQSIDGKSESRREGRGVESDGQCTRSDRRPLHQNRGAIDGARCLPAAKLVRQARERIPHADDLAGGRGSVRDVDGKGRIAELR